MIDWPRELPAIWRAARGSAALYVALVALRKIEAGGPGREFGVLSTPAPTFEAQLSVAVVSLRNGARRYELEHGRPALTPEGFYTEDFLRTFSARWAPLGAPNDPHALNANHADNLVTVAARAAEQFAAKALTVTV